MLYLLVFKPLCMFEKIGGEYQPNDFDEAAKMLEREEFANARKALDSMGTDFDPKREVMKADLARQKLSEQTADGHEKIRRAAEDDVLELEDVGGEEVDDLEHIAEFEGPIEEVTG